MRKVQGTKDISYAHAAKTRPGRVVIRVMENSTGRLRLLRKAKGYEQDIASRGDFWRVMCDRYGLDLSVHAGALGNIPTTGPLIIVSNHPFGILDGLMLGRILSERRGDDFRIMANSVFCKSNDLARVVLPISFDKTKEAALLNVQTRKDALSYLAQGGAIGVFPGGTVSTSARPFSQPLDPQWRNFTAKMVARSGATVVPIFFEGANSRLFQLASQVSQTLRMGLLIREFRTRVGREVGVTIGDTIDPQALAQHRDDPKSCMDFLRKATYELSPKPLPLDMFGREFEAKYKKAG